MSDEQAKEPAADDLDVQMARFEGNFIESADLMQKQATLTIEGVVPPMVEKDKNGQGKPIDKAIISFRGTTKRLIVGKTNERIIKAIHGKKASGWIGKQIKIGVRFLREAFGEKNVPTVRVIPPPEIPLPMAARKFFGAESPYGS